MALWAYPLLPQSLRVFPPPAAEIFYWSSIIAKRFLNLNSVHIFYRDCKEITALYYYFDIVRVAFMIYAVKLQLKPSRDFISRAFKKLIRKSAVKDLHNIFKH